MTSTSKLHSGPDTTNGDGRIAGVVFDIDGVLMVSGRPIRGARETVELLQRNDVPFVFLTNMTRPRSAVLASLTGLGVDVDPSRILSAPSATVAYVNRTYPRQHCLLLADSALREDFDSLPLTADPEEAGVVVIGGPHDDGDNEWLSYAYLNAAYRALGRGAALIAMQRGMSWETRIGPALDAGAYVAGLEAATGVKATVCGKPSRHFFEEAVNRMGLPAGQVLMVGDDVENDVRGSVDAGLRAALVRTGKFRPGHVDAVRGVPMQLIDSVADVPRLLGIAPG